MHSEHLTNVRFSAVAFGWFVGFAVASSLILLMVGAGLMSTISGEALGLAVAVAVGWAVGGFLTGVRTAAAPILHGTAIALFTFVVWFLVNLVVGGLTTGIAAWEGIPTRVAALSLLVQGVAAIAGCWAGYRYAPVRVE
jgi:hypothetical protein